jgi:subtilase family serine protease
VAADNASGGSRAVGIVDAFHAPNVRIDLNAYSRQFGLPQTTAATFVIWYCGATLASCNQRTPPAYNADWEGEITLDVEMVHALAPHAKIILVEAKSNSNADLTVATQKAAQLVAASNGGQVSMSFGHTEFSGDFKGNNPLYTVNKVVFFASSGDDPSVSYPSAAPNVVSVGGTSVSRGKFGNLIGESAWYDAGAGISIYQPRPSYQNGIASMVGTHRGTPDLAAMANPRTGAWVRLKNGWYAFGGTSAASPLVAAIVNAAGHFKWTSLTELAYIYASRTTPGAYQDIVQGVCGPWTGYWSRAGWDHCTGNGAPRGLVGK